MTAADFKQLADTVARVERHFDSDLVFFNGDITEEMFPNFVRLCRSDRNRSGMLLILVTLGGSPDAGYRIARYIQNVCLKFRVFIPAMCKSTGTLVTIGASEIIISDLGELGPLDIQLRKLDEVGELSSGMNIMAALTTLEARANQGLESCFLRLKARYQSITLKTCLEVASNLTQGLYGNLYRQIDPMYLGEVGRSIRIAESYGKELNEKADNLKDKDETLSELIAGYPSHGYVIDRVGAERLFKRVTPPTKDLEYIELFLREKCGFIGDIPKTSNDFLVLFLHKFSLEWHKILQEEENTRYEQQQSTAEYSANPEGTGPKTDEPPGPAESDLRVHSEVVQSADGKQTHTTPPGAAGKSAAETLTGKSPH